MKAGTKNKNLLMLLSAAIIWGFAFVSQSTGGDAIGPYSFNCIRSLLGSLVLLPVIRLFSKKTARPESKKLLWTGGIICGIILCIASNLQQLGINAGTPVGKAGFITSCYIIFVPIIGIFLKQKTSLKIWIGMVLTVIGLYLLCMSGDFSLQLSDILVFLCAISFSLHILIIDHFSPSVDGVKLSCIQFFVCGILTAIPALITEVGFSSESISTWAKGFNDLSAWPSLLYSGICSCGIAYTLQILGQKNFNPSLASLILSLESVFSVLAGSVLLGQFLSSKELLGCLLIFIAVILAQLPSPKPEQ